MGICKADRVRILVQADRIITPQHPAVLQDPLIDLRVDQIIVRAALQVTVVVVRTASAAVICHAVPGVVEAGVRWEAVRAEVTADPVHAVAAAVDQEAWEDHAAAAVGGNER